jgi:hypothetical protein
MEDTMRCMIASPSSPVPWKRSELVNAQPLSARLDIVRKTLENHDHRLPLVG